MGVRVWGDWCPGKDKCAEMFSKCRPGFIGAFESLGTPFQACCPPTLCTFGLPEGPRGLALHAVPGCCPSCQVWLPGRLEVPQLQVAMGAPPPITEPHLSSHAVQAGAAGMPEQQAADREM